MVRLILGFVRQSDEDIISRGYAVYYSMENNPRFPKPPFKLTDFKAALDSFTTAKGATADGGRMAFAEKNKLRDTVIKMMRHLGHYVELEADGDIEKLVSSGFEVFATSSPGPTDPCPQPRILNIRQGHSGELLVSFTALYRQAAAYELRHAPQNADESSDTWTARTLTKARPAVRISDLTPGTIYAFQVRALGKDGNYTDWSNSVTRRCI